MRVRVCVYLMALLRWLMRAHDEPKVVVQQKVLGVVVAPHDARTARVVHHATPLLWVTPPVCRSQRNTAGVMCVLAGGVCVCVNPKHSLKSLT